MTEDLSDPDESFLHERRLRSAANREDRPLQEATDAFLREIVRTKYSFNFLWLGRPVIQIPQDLFAMQEIIWATRPDFVVETGIARGGSLVFYASILELAGNGRVIGIDIEIREKNRFAIERHPLAHRIEMIEGSSVSPDVVRQVRELTAGAKSVLVALDSDHTHDHVLRELEEYAPLVTPGSYCVVFDTGIENLPPGMITDRPWGRGNSPMTAAQEYLRRLGGGGHFAADGGRLMFERDKDIEGRLLVTAAPRGYLRRVTKVGSRAAPRAAPQP